MLRCFQSVLPRLTCIANCVRYSYSLVIFAFSKPFNFNLIILELDNIEENMLIYKKGIELSFREKKRWAKGLQVGREEFQLKKTWVKGRKCEKDRKLWKNHFMTNFFIYFIPFNALDQFSLKYFTCKCVWGRVQTISEIPPLPNIKPTLTNIFSLQKFI